jgi:hypothetical protein
MLEDKIPRLALGEYDWPDSDQSWVVRTARAELIRVAGKIYKPFSNGLAETVLPVYQRLATEEHSHLLLTGSYVERLPSEHQELRTKLLAWARRFNAEEGWVLDNALRTLRAWFTDPILLNDLEWVITWPGVAIQRVVGEPFCSSGWDVRSHSWALYRQSVLDQLAEYEGRTRTMAETKGMQRVPRTYSKANLEWFAKFQFAGLSAMSIVKGIVVKDKRSTLTESTVTKGIHTAADLIHWTQLRARRTK